MRPFDLCVPWIQDRDQNKFKASRLLRCNIQPEQQHISTIQKRRQPATLHQHVIKPPSINNQTNSNFN